MPAHTDSPSPWDDAVRRATAAIAAERPGGMDESCWDDVAMRGIVAMVLYALHLRERRAVDEIRWEAVLWQLRDDQRVEALVTAVLPGAGHDLTRTAAPGEPVAECWRWLTRTWDPNAPTKGSALAFMGPTHQPESLWVPDTPEFRWDGMSRGVGSGLPDPALEVGVNWAAGVVQSAITSESGGYGTHQRVKVKAGPLKGHRGYVRELGWVFNDEAQTVEGPAGYVVDLDDVEGLERLDADHLTRGRDHQWPRRPQGTLKVFPPPLRDPLPPRKTCGQDLEEILDRASNPEIVPPQLRQTIASAKEHHHLTLDAQATPAPQRFTWHVLMHWYQLTEHYADDQRADLYEVVIKRHLHDTSPKHYLALREDDMPDLITRCMAAAE
ncbi:hypothetical protein [Streptomyces sp. CT34]|uniref:hypothetical protein n=1 Tax=Streptomyces sp. CT34 TaxID=1553907 RepID=UPI0012FED80E|nr:hypothetical protein [Streptomyces sp. CT34]